MNNIEDTICVFAWDYPVLNLSRNELRYCCRARSNTLTEEDFKKLAANVSIRPKTKRDIKIH